MNQVKIVGESALKPTGRLEGRVKFYIPEKQFGFIWNEESDRSQEIYLNKSQFKNGLTTLNQGDIISFEVEHMPDERRRATNIEFVRRATPAELQEIRRASREAKAKAAADGIQRV